MDTTSDLEIFLVAPPGLEPTLCAEAIEKGFAEPTPGPGGVTLRGDWPEVWRANLELRGAARVLVRVGGFRAFHLAQLDKRARKFPWRDVLRPDRPLHVEVTCRKSKIYHAGAAAQRIERAISDVAGVPISAEAEVRLLARIDDNLVTFSVDTSGEPLHRRGHKQAVGKAPMRENLAALFLRECGYRGDEPVVDPMCGSGTFVIEAAEIAAGLHPGRSRRFAFEDLATFDASAWQAMRAAQPVAPPPHRFFGFDRDAGAIKASRENAERAGVADVIAFAQQPVSDLTPPDGPPGLVIVNPPYGGRIGNRKLLFALYGRMGEILRERFRGWRVGIVTSDAGLARSTGLPFAPDGPKVPHGSLKVQLFRAGPLP
ncbi:class I SAM-dependent RNA methyltransferase [Rhodovulum sp. P5]|uniref:THUMP domain-containing class I SAM-dependent RNA methyltransferase n=1 Tax=Rhodovulum sp. P5 TaxID=1564506 RepID=UPI0009DB0E80|nr:RNA methyltransferase [Rhodovulum sp. P5]